MQSELNQVLGPDATILRDILSQKRIAHIQLYGSNLNMDQMEHDIDLLVIIDESCEYERRMISPFDLVFLSRREALRLARSFDPVITEPVLTGKTIAGSPVIDKWKLEHSEVSKKACYFLCYRAKKVLNWTISSAGGKQAVRQLLNSAVASNIIQNLSYVASYMAFSIHYAKTPEPLTLEQLCQIYPNSLVATLRQYKNGVEFIIADIESILDSLEGFLSISPPHLSSTWVLEGTFNPKQRR